MKLLSYRGKSGAVQLGALSSEGNHVVDLAEAARRTGAKHAASFQSLQALVEAGPGAMDDARLLVEGEAGHEAVHALAAVTRLAPFPRPLALRDCIGFTGHLVNTARRVIAGGRLKKLDAMLEKSTGRTIAGMLMPTAWERPLYYFSNVCGVVGDGADIPVPCYTQALDYELEWAAVIGRQGRNIRESEARSHIVGYMIFNDVSARDVQLAEMKGRLGVQKGKSFDGCNVLGPWLVTSDEIPQPYTLEMWATVNGEEWSRGNTSQQDWTFEQMIEFMSRSETLYPGEIIGSGTVPTGCGLELGRQIKAGDLVQLNVEGIGSLTNRIVAGDAYQPLPTRSG